MDLGREEEQFAQNGLENNPLMTDRPIGIDSEVEKDAKNVTINNDGQRSPAAAGDSEEGSGEYEYYYDDEPTASAAEWNGPGSEESNSSPPSSSPSSLIDEETVIPENQESRGRASRRMDSFFAADFEEQLTNIDYYFSFFEVRVLMMLVVRFMFHNKTFSLSVPLQLDLIHWR